LNVSGGTFHTIIFGTLYFIIHSSGEDFEKIYQEHYQGKILQFILSTHTYDGLLFLLQA